MNNQATDREIGKRLRILRKRRGWTQTDLADLVNVTYQQIQKYENGSNRIAASRLLQLSRKLEVPIDLFFVGIDESGQCQDSFEDILALVQTFEAARTEDVVKIFRDNIAS